MLTRSVCCTATHSVQTQAMRISSLHEGSVQTFELKVSEILSELKVKFTASLEVSVSDPELTTLYNT